MSKLRPSSRRIRRLVAALAGVVAVVAVSSVAYAAFVNTGSVGGPGSGDGELAVPERAAVEQSTGNLFVVDSGNDRVQVFSPDGGSVGYLTQFGSGVLDSPYGIAVDETAGQTVVYVTSETNGGEIVKFESDEAANPAFSVDAGYGSPAQGAAADQVSSFDSALALAPNGDVWVADSGANVVKRFTSAGAHVAGSNFDGSDGATAFAGLLDVAVNAAGDVYLIDADGPIKSGPDGTPAPTGISKALRYTAAGAFTSELAPVGPNQRPATVAVDGPTGTVAVSGEQDAIHRDQSPTVHLFDNADAPIESFTVEGPINYETVAALAFTDNTDRLYVVTDYGYWSDGGSYGSQPGIQVYQDLVLVAPEATIAPATAVGKFAATVNGTVDPNGFEVTTCRFAYVTDAQYQQDGFSSAQTQNCATAPGNGDDPVDVAADLAGLAPATLYHYRLYAQSIGGDHTSSEQPFTTDPIFPPTATIDEVTTADSTTATLTGEVDPNSLATDYRFQHRVVGATTWTDTPTQTTGTDTDPVPVQADIDGLNPVTDYEARLIVENTDGDDTTEVVEFSTTAGPPLVETRPAGDLTDTSALLRARINPAGEQSTFQFKWGTTTSYTSQVPAEPVAIGGSNTQKVVSRSLTGLQPNTTYHYRIAATNAEGTTNGQDQTFTTTAIPDPCSNGAIRNTQGSDYLADCRAYELVSPPNKIGADVMMQPSRTRVSTTETPALPRAVTFGSLGGFADVQGSGIAFDYIAQRTAQPGTQGWTTHATTPNQAALDWVQVLNGRTPLYVADSDPSLTKGIFRAFSPIGPAPNTEKVPNLYLRTDLRKPGQGNYQLLTDAFAPIPQQAVITQGDRPFVADASTDLSHVLFESRFQLAADAPSSYNVLKTYMAIDGEVSYVGYVPPAGLDSCTGAECEAASGATIPGQGATDAGGNYTLHAPNALSADGSRAVFVEADPTASNFPEASMGELYLRDDRGTADPLDDRTTRLNASERTSPDPEPSLAMFSEAATDAGRVFFTTFEALTDDAPISNQNKLYMWTLEPNGDGNHLTFLSADAEPDDGTGEVVGVLGSSDSGDTVYYVHKSQLVSDEPALGARFGIYVWREGEGVSYLGEMGDMGDAPGGSNWAQADNQLGARVTPDGDRLLISLRQPPWPGGFDHGHCPQSQGGLGGTLIDGRVGCAEFYMYDVVTKDRPVCVTCDVEGPAPSLDTFFFREIRAGGGGTVNHLTSPLTDDGGRVFFSSPAALVSRDVNGKYDAYMWEAPGHGSCQGAQLNGGCVSLLSSGQGSSDSYFMEASPDGSNVFFLTYDQLVGWDVDQNRDLYVARVGGGLAEPKPGEAPCLDHQGCQGAPTTPPAAGRPGSADLVGAGNPKPSARAARCSTAKRKLAKNRRVLSRAKSTPQRRKAKRAVRKAKRRLATCRKAAR